MEVVGETAPSIDHVDGHVLIQRMAEKLGQAQQAMAYQELVIENARGVIASHEATILSLEGLLEKYEAEEQLPPPD